MKIEAQNSDETVLRELGSRLARTRLERNMTQEELANDAGIGKSTLERIEGGREVRVSSLIRALRALGQIEVLDRLIPEPLPSPIGRARLRGGERKRAGRPRKPQDPHEPAPWQWADDEPGDEPPETRLWRIVDPDSERDES